MANNGNQSNNNESPVNNISGSTGSSQSNGQQQQNGSNGQSNDRRGTGSSYKEPSIPDEVGTPDCPVCLCRVQNRAYTDTCLHEFCFSCIQEWSHEHNRCPVCRAVFKRILHNIRSKHDYDEEEVAEPPNPNSGLLIVMGDMGLLVTPETTGLYIINPMSTPHGMRHMIEYYGPRQQVLLTTINPNMVIVPPDDLETTLQGMGAHPHHPHHGRHPNWLQWHRRHH